MSSLREEKQVERNSQPLLQIHQPKAELGNTMHPQPASAPWQVAWRAPLFTWGPSWKRCFPKKIPNIGFFHRRHPQQHLRYLSMYKTIVAFLHWPKLIHLCSVLTSFSLNQNLSCRRKAQVSSRYEKAMEDNSCSPGEHWCQWMFRFPISLKLPNVFDRNQNKVKSP